MRPLIILNTPSPKFAATLIISLCKIVPWLEKGFLALLFSGYLMRATPVKKNVLGVEGNNAEKLDRVLVLN